MKERFYFKRDVPPPPQPQQCLQPAQNIQPDESCLLTQNTMFAVSHPFVARLQRTCREPAENVQRCESHLEAQRG